MITDCNSCCFLKKLEDGVTCQANQLCIAKEQSVSTPGFCKTKRSEKWAKRQQQEQTRSLDIQDLVCMVDLENKLSFDLIVVFDETKQTIETLNKTLSFDWTNKFCKQIIIADITGKPKRDKQFLNSIKNYTGIPLVIDCSCDNENRVRAIRRLTIKCKQKYFMIIPAGQKLSNINNLYDHLQNNDSRNIYYRFPTKFGFTKIDPIDNNFYGLYITHMFKFLTSRCDEECIYNQPCECKVFQEDITKMEKQCQIKLSNIFWDCAFHNEQKK